MLKLNFFKSAEAILTVLALKVLNSVLEPMPEPIYA